MNRGIKLYKGDVFYFRKNSPFFLPQKKKKKKKGRKHFSDFLGNFVRTKAFSSILRLHQPIFDIVRSDLHDSRSVPAFRTVSPSSCHPLVSWFIGKFDLDALYTYKGCPIMASAYTLFLFRYFSLFPFFFFAFLSSAPSFRLAQPFTSVCFPISLSFSLSRLDNSICRSGGLISYQFTSEPL